MPTGSTFSLGMFNIPVQVSMLTLRHIISCVKATTLSRLMGSRRVPIRFLSQEKVS